MNIDRRAFLAFATMIAGATATACGAADDSAGQGQSSSDITGASAEGSVAEGGACFDDGEAAFPYEEGTTCFDLYVKGIDDDYKNWTSVDESGKTLAESHKCQPVGSDHPASEASGLPMCPTYAADFAYGKCHEYVTQYKAQSAASAVKCLTKVPDLTDSMAIYDCGFDALDKACPFHPTAESSCDEIGAALAKQGKKFSDEVVCWKQLSGLRASARAAILAEANSGTWYGIHSAIESLPNGL